MIPEELIEEIAAFEPITYEMVRERLERRGMRVRIDELRDHWGTFMLDHGLIQRAQRLRNNVVGYYNTLSLYSDSIVLKTYFEIYDKIRYDVVRLFSSDKAVHSLPYLGVVKRLDKEQLLRIMAGLDQIIGFLEGKQIEVLGTSARKFPVQEKELDILPSTTKLLLLEAIAEYDHFHSYACCCICGLAFESIVKEGCKKKGLAYEGLAKGIKALKEADVIKEDL